jgi:hypothetical protein
MEKGVIFYLFLLHDVISLPRSSARVPKSNDAQQWDMWPKLHR